MTAEVPTRDRIVRSAARLFLARSYLPVGVKEICAAAAAPKGSFYHFFPAKSDLAIAVVDHYAAALWKRLDERERRRRGPANKIQATAGVVGVVQGRLHQTFGWIVGCPLGNLAVELATVEEAAGRHVARVLAQWEARVAMHCHDADEVDLLAASTDPDNLARQVIAPMQGMILLAKISGDGPEGIAPAMHRVIDAGLRRPAA
jgi:TetR/AcrR family transcriptional repressor of nem operon